MAHPECYRWRQLGAECQAPYVAPANAMPPTVKHTSILGIADTAGC